MTPAYSKIRDVPVASDFLCEPVPRPDEVLRNVDAAKLFESAPNAMILVNRAGRIATLNAEAERMFGYHRDELTGQPVERLIPEGFGHDRIVAGTRLERHGFRRDGSEFPVDIGLSPVETKEGSLISSVIRDISKTAGNLTVRLAFERLISRLSTAFINLPEDRIEDEVGYWLKDLGEALDLDRVTVALSGTIVRSWARPGIPPAPPCEGTELFDWRPRVSSVEDLPEGASAERAYMLSAGVKSWLTIPLVAGGEKLGGIAAAMLRTKRVWDSLLIMRLQLAAEVFANALARKAVTDHRVNERALAEQLAFATLLTELSATFINLPADQVDGQIEVAQRRICEALGLDRSTVIQLSPSGDRVISSHSWAAEGFRPYPHVSLQELPWAARTVLSGDVICFARIDDLPPEAAKDKEFLCQHGPKSNMTIPLSTGGKVIGAVGFGALRAEREWPALMVEKLSLVAEVFANAIARKRAGEDLRAAYSHIEELKQQLERENLCLREEIKLEQVHHEVVGGSEAIRRILKSAEQVAKTDATVLMLGATGTGKELIARAIHAYSNRRNRPMVKVNCAALPATLIESELFGRERGAYTGALTREIGRFELANESTIFLDEIGELPLELQAKLLRVLQEGEFERLGSPKTIHVDVRVIAATARDLEAAITEGKFREDLFYRLNVFPITIPPLRERREDIPPLVWHFLNELGPRMGRQIESVHGPTMEAFKNYAWPGNVRELRNVVERLLITTTGTMLRSDWQLIEKAVPVPQGQTLKEIERSHILRILEATRWHIRGKGGAAEVLAMKATTLESRMQKLGIVRPG